MLLVYESNRAVCAVDFPTFCIWLIVLLWWHVVYSSDPHIFCKLVARFRCLIGLGVVICFGSGVFCLFVLAKLV